MTLLGEALSMGERTVYGIIAWSTCPGYPHVHHTDIRASQKRTVTLSHSYDAYWFLHKPRRIFSTFADEQP
jgi:hypothetical protein